MKFKTFPFKQYFNISESLVCEHKWACSNKLF